MVLSFRFKSWGEKNTQSMVRRKRNKAEEAKEKGQLWAQTEGEHPSGVSAVGRTPSAAEELKKRFHAEVESFRA